MPTFVSYIIYDLGENDADVLAGVTNVTQENAYMNYFENKKEVKTVFTTNLGIYLL